MRNRKEGGSVQSSARVREAVLWSVGTNIPLGSNHGYLQMK